MSSPRRLRWASLLTLNVVSLCVLGFYQPGHAEPKETLPFANAVEQRAEMIQQLKELNAQLKEQTALLKSGKVQVLVAEPRR